jgi:membrane-associated protease RseP (regulator of RpoE activity)
MLNEQASSSLDQPIRRRGDYEERPADPYDDLREMVGGVMHITAERRGDELDDDALNLMSPGHDFLITFEGELTKNSETAYDELDEQLKQHDRFALFRNNDEEDGAPHHIHVLQGRVVPVEGKPWLNLLLFVLTLASVFFVGSVQGISYALEQNPDLDRSEFYYQFESAETGEVAEVPRLSQIWRGYPYALSLLLILGAHELGHYFAARRHNHAVSLPYFIPMPISILGTMGAVIRSREPMRNRKVLMDIGAAGPLAGMVFAVPILLIGLATSPVAYRLEPGTHGLEGNSILYALAKVVTLGQFYPTETQDVFINQMAFAGWLGLLVTALNLIPVGQLDGGHVLYSLFGMRARRAFYPIIVAMIGLALISQVWLFWVILLVLLGRIYAPPLDDITPLDNRRRGIAIFTLVIFVLVFVPRPFTFYTVDEDDIPQPTPGQQAYYTPPEETVLTFDP